MWHACGVTPQNSKPHPQDTRTLTTNSLNHAPRPTRQLAKFEEEQFGISGDFIRAPKKSFTISEFPGIQADLQTGRCSYVDYQTEFARLRASRESILRELKLRFTAPQLAGLAAALGATGVSGATKTHNAERIYRGMLRTFVLDETFSDPVGKNLEEAIASHVENTTSQDLFDHYFRKDWEARQPQELHDDQRLLSHHDLQFFARNQELG